MISVEILRQFVKEELGFKKMFKLRFNSKGIIWWILMMILLVTTLIILILDALSPWNLPTIFYRLSLVAGFILLCITGTIVEKNEKRILTSGFGNKYKQLPDDPVWKVFSYEVFRQKQKDGDFIRFSDKDAERMLYQIDRRYQRKVGRKFPVWLIGIILAQVLVLVSDFFEVRITEEKDLILLIIVAVVMVAYILIGYSAFSGLSNPIDRTVIDILEMHMLNYKEEEKVEEEQKERNRNHKKWPYNQR